MTHCSEARRAARQAKATRRGSDSHTAKKKRPGGSAPQAVDALPRKRVISQPSRAALAGHRA